MRKIPVGDLADLRLKKALCKVLGYEFEITEELIEFTDGNGISFYAQLENRFIKEDEKNERCHR